MIDARELVRAALVVAAKEAGSYCHWKTAVDRILSIDPAEIIARVVPAEPVAYARPDELQKVSISPYLCHLRNARDKQSDMVPLYTATVVAAPTPVDGEAERRLFMEQLAANYGNCRLSPKVTNCGILTDDFADPRVQMAFEMWLAGRAAAPQAERPSAVDDHDAYVLDQIRKDKEFAYAYLLVTHGPAEQPAQALTDFDIVTMANRIIDYGYLCDGPGPAELASDEARQAGIVEFARAIEARVKGGA